MSRVSSIGHLEQKAYRHIREMIIRGELKPGDLVIQENVAQRIGISRTPLRRAMTELERDYYLETTSQGIVVREFDRDFIQSIWDVRAVLEGLACRLVAKKIDEATIAYLRTLFEVSYKKWDEGDRDSYREADIIFHTKIVELSGNPVLKQNIRYTKVLEIAFDQGLLRPPSETYQEHMDILMALEKKDEILSEKLMLEHLRKTTPFLPTSF